MFIVLLVVLATVTPSPAVSLTVVSPAVITGQQFDTVVRLLNSDPRFEDFTVTISSPSSSPVVIPIHAPIGETQVVTFTHVLAILPPPCGSQTGFSFSVVGHVVSSDPAFDGLSLSHIDIGGARATVCSPRVYLPL